MKKCTKCGEVKRLEEFSKCKTKKDGRASHCKACRKQYYQDNREKLRQLNKQYEQANRQQISERKKQYYEANHEKIAEYHKEYYKANREKVLEQRKQYLEDNREQVAKKRKRYYQDNKEAYRLHNQKRRAAKANAAGHCTPEQLQARFDYHGNRCVYCGSEKNLQIEHMIPISKGGTNWPANLAPACESCNKSKHARKTFVEFKAEKST